MICANNRRILTRPLVSSIARPIQPSFIIKRITWSERHAGRCVCLGRCGWYTWISSVDYLVWEQIDDLWYHTWIAVYPTPPSLKKKKKKFVETWVLSRPADTLLAHTTTLHFFLTFLLLVELVAKSIRYWIVEHPLPSNYGAGVKVATGFDPEVPDGLADILVWTGTNHSPFQVWRCVELTLYIHCRYLPHHPISISRWLY